MLASASAGGMLPRVSSRRQLLNQSTIRGLAIRRPRSCATGGDGGCPLSLRNVEDPLHERGIEVSHETVRFWWNRFGPKFATEIRRRRVDQMRSLTHWKWHLDEVFVKINGVTHYLWRAVDHKGEVLESFVSKTAIARQH